MTTSEQPATATVDGAESAQPQALVLTVEQAAARLGIGRTLMSSLVAIGAVESVTIGRFRRIPADALVHYVNGLRGGVDKTETPEPEPGLRSGDPTVRPPSSTVRADRIHAKMLARYHATAGEAERLAVALDYVRSAAAAARSADVQTDPALSDLVRTVLRVGRSFLDQLDHRGSRTAAEQPTVDGTATS
ncbi:MAG: helix-turn-helix domain-containing protein [Pseudonocardia sp.]